MIDFYNAFISYRHAKLDSAIAENVQRKLEHFHVPHKLKKKIKHQKITRIFRDKDELPITSDLTETITDALRKAEYLIVICSTNTKESIWVKREIATFLQTHTKDKILTVLCDGEPQEVIPEELLTTQKEYVDENGFSHLVNVPVEPLSCDYRLPRSRADKEELPRLASALLGCSYDELLRRRRQYRIRRAAAIIGVVFAGLAAFGAYALYSRQKINESYLEALRNRSIFLANESSQLLADNKRVDAAQLALAALPKGPDDKTPVTAAAVRAITDATYAYSSSVNISYDPIWNFKTARSITKCIFSENEKYIAALDQSGCAYCWNIQSHELLFRSPGDNNPTDIVFLGEDTILLTFKNSIEAYNIETGTKIWSLDTECNNNMDDVVYVDNHVYLDVGDGLITKVSVRDGSIKEQYEVLKDEIIRDTALLSVSPDGKKIAYVKSEILFNTEKIYLYDTQTKTESSLLVDAYFAKDLFFIDSEHLMLMAADSIMDSSVSFSDELTYLMDTTVKLYCFDGKLNSRWNGELTYSDMSIKTGYLYLPGRNAVTIFAGTGAGIYDIDTGKVLNMYRTSSAITSVNDFNLNDNPEFICQHGELVFAMSDDKNDLATLNVLCNNINTSKIGNFVYCVQSNSTDIICYTSHLQNEEWKAIKSPADYSPGSTSIEFYSDQEYLILATLVEGADKTVRVSVIDPTTSELVFYEDVTDPEGYISQRHIEYVDGKYYCFIGDNIYYIDMNKEKLKQTDLTTDYNVFVSNGKLITCEMSSEFTVEVTDLDGSHSIFMEHDDFEGVYLSSICGAVYLEELDKVVIAIGKHMLVADLDTEEIEEIDLPDNWIESYRNNFYAVVSEDGSHVLLTDSETLLVTDKDFKEQYTILCRSSVRFGATFKDDILYVVADEGLALYNAKDGQLIKKYALTNWGMGEAKFTFYDKEHELFIQTGDQINIFDTEAWVELASIFDVLCYNEESDVFYTYSYTTVHDCSIGYIKHYSVEELIEKAEEYLGGQEIDEDTKTKYGL